jgi:protein TonB
MFQDIAQPSTRVGSRKAYALPLSVFTHVLLVALLLITPLIAPTVLPMPAATILAFVSRDIVLPSPPPSAPRPRVDVAQPPAEVRAKAAPLEAPSTITAEPVVESAPIVPRDNVGVVPGEITDGLAPPVPFPPPLSSPLPAPPTVPVRVGGDIRPPAKIIDVKPAYPPIAQAARLEGVVIIEATIGPTGSVVDAKLLRSIPLLDAAALEAVRQWEFTPTLLNGSPVSVVMTVTVNFTLK